MNLQKYDNKLIQIIDNQNNKYEGICEYYNQEYSFHEYGKDEDCLEIFGFLFYKKDIKKTKSSERHTNWSSLYGLSRKKSKLIAEAT